MIKFLRKRRQAQRQARSALEALQDLKAEVEKYDQAMDDPHGDGTGNDARPPEGDDYNELFGMVRVALYRAGLSERIY